MSNNNQIPWKIIIPAIVVILAAIIGATWTFLLNPPPSDFDISVNPMKGEVLQGGVLATAITIRGIQGYEHPVSLSASEQPSDVVVTIIPTIIGGPRPSHTSNVMISVDSSVPVGDYKIIMKGTGTDGKEHSCCYNLRVKPTGTPTPTPTITPTPTSMSTPASRSGLTITFSQNPTRKVTRGTWIIFNWEITKEPPSFLAGESYLLEIQGPTDKQRYSQVFQTPRESCSNFTYNYSWIVPDDEPLGSHTSFLELYNAGSYITFEVVETLLVIQKFNDINLNGKIDNGVDERLGGWEFKVTDPDGKTTTHFTDANGEIRIQIIDGREGKYLLEEILKPGWGSVLPTKQTVNVPKGKTTNVNFLNAGTMAVGLLLIQKFNDTNLNGKIERSDERLAGWEFKVTDPGGEITTRLTDYSGEIRLEVPAEYEGKEYIIEETLLPGWEPVHPIKQTVKVLKGEGITVKFLNKKPISITLTYNDFELEDVCTPEDNYCGWANVPGEAIIYGSITTNITVPEGASELEVTISIGCNGYGEGLLGLPGSAAYIRVDNEVREERIDSTMNSHHGNYYKYEWCDTFSNKFNVTRKEEITLIIEMSGGARLDFKDAILTFS